MALIISAPVVKTWLHDGREIAVFDVREHGQYGEGHLFHGIPVPLSVLETEAPRLAPNTSVRLVVYDGGDVEDAGGTIDGDIEGDAGGDVVDGMGRPAARAARQLERLGYTAVHILDGGALAWAAAGFVLFKGVNLPSKAFGEWVEQINHTPHITGRALAERLAGPNPPVVLDGRPFAEFQKMSIPQAVCCPNGELALRLRQLVPDKDTTIVINCAGRTRSIIGAQTLIHLGVENPVLALENGTQGWFLDDLPLEHGKQHRYPARTGSGRDAGTTESAARDTGIRQRAHALAERTGVEWVTAEQVSAWHADPARSLFLCDVRTPEEFASGSLPGARHAPGGQLQQATDHYIGVRHARVVVFDDDGIRAPVTASWLRQLGHAAYVLREGTRSGLALTARERITVAPDVRTLGVGELAMAIRAETVVVIDLRRSQTFREGHISGAVWSIRPLLPGTLRRLSAGRPDVPVILIGEASGEPGVNAGLDTGSESGVDVVPDHIRWAVSELAPKDQGRIRYLSGGFDAWRRAGEPVVSSPASPPDSARIDFLFFTHDRHHGNKAAARQYLEWELGLLAQLDERERAEFRPLVGSAAV